MDDRRQVAAVVQNHVEGTAIGPEQGLLDAPLVFFLRFSLPGEDRSAGGGDRGGSMVLSRKDVATRPADLGTELDERFDEDGGLDRHVQTAGDAGSLERLGGPVFCTEGHQPGHLVLGQFDLLASPLREVDVLDAVGQGLGRGHGRHPE